jgi:NMD protein affecting ribosome stability and mRNA decay
MATKRQYIKGVTPCAGMCGRQLRPSYLRLDEMPGTVRRHAQGMCKYCHRRTEPMPVKGEGKVVRPCTACGFKTRPGKVKAADFPGTRIRVGELCRNCDSACVTVTDDRARYIKGEVVAYLRSRGRVIPPELLKEAS